jgi:hypothetical protein
MAAAAAATKEEGAAVRSRRMRWRSTATARIMMAGMVLSRTIDPSSSYRPR